MTRATNAVAFHKRLKRLYKKAKGFWGDRKNHRRQTKDAVMKSLADNYRHRKLRKRQFRNLWTVRVNVAANGNGISYSKLINGLKRANCTLNRKMLSELAIHDPKAFSEVVNVAKKALVA
jgi:large subunit ribosomal protein L20